ncbi:MAG: biotin transporter BioY [Oscillospiraceae bacterium]
MKEKVLDTRGMVLCALFTALIAVGAFIKIPIPGVPFSLQFLFTNMAGLLLGRRRGLISVGLYIFLGLVGLPIFTGGGGIGYVLYPTFGYLVGMAVGTYLCGLISERGEKCFKTFLVAGLVNLLVVYALGMLHYYLIARFYVGNPVGLKTLLVSCFLIFVPGDSLSSIVGALLAKRLRPIAMGRAAAKA